MWDFFCDFSITLLSYLYLRTEFTVPDIGDLYRDSMKQAEEYEACLTTTIYGQKYLDPEKCKARGYDPAK